MAEPLKAFFDRARVEAIAADLAQAWPAFPRAQFVRDATRGLDDLELMGRGKHIGDALARALPADVPEALDILVRSLGPPLPAATGNGMAPFHYLPHAMFLASHALEHPERALAAQRELTRRFTCEASIRPYLDRHPELTYAALDAWSRDADEHVRRLVSEGTRPRLPWAPRLARYDAARVLPLLEPLRDDPSEYVRRSVANHLNDLSREDPALALAACARWLPGAPEPRRRLVAHALRSLVRAGHPEAIRLLGGDEGGAIEASARCEPPRPRIGGTVRVVVTLRNPTEEDAQAVLVVRVHFLTARGGTSVRSFRLRTTVVPAKGEVELRKPVSLRQHTTRTHHPGKHRVEIVANGEVVATAAFVLGA